MIKFILGESRQLKFEVSKAQDTAFVISSSTYEILKDNDEVDSGNMTIDNHILTMSFTPEERGYYWLEITYVIGPDTVKARYKIDVD